MCTWSLTAWQYFQSEGWKREGEEKHPETEEAEEAFDLDRSAAARMMAAVDGMLGSRNFMLGIDLISHWLYSCEENEIEEDKDIAS